MLKHMNFFYNYESMI